MRLREQMIWREVDSVVWPAKAAVLAYHVARRLGLAHAIRPLHAELDPPVGAPVAFAQRLRLATSTRDLGPDLGIWDQVVLDYFRLPQFLPADDWVVVDVGSNVGLYALAVCALARNVTVHAFEPMPYPYARLVANCRHNGLSRVQCENAALGAQSTEGRWMYSVNASKVSEAFQGAFDPGVVGDPAQCNGSDVGIEVTELRFDDYARRNHLTHLDLVKIDVEGAEQEVLSGMEWSLGNVDRLVLEWHGKARQQWCRSWLIGQGFIELAEWESHGSNGDVGIQYYVQQRCR